MTNIHLSATENYIQKTFICFCNQSSITHLGHNKNIVMATDIYRET